MVNITKWVRLKMRYIPTDHFLGTFEALDLGATQPSLKNTQILVDYFEKSIDFILEVTSQAVAFRP